MKKIERVLVVFSLLSFPIFLVVSASILWYVPFVSDFFHVYHFSGIGLSTYGPPPDGYDRVIVANETALAFYLLIFVVFPLVVLLLSFKKLYRFFQLIFFIWLLLVIIAGYLFLKKIETSDGRYCMTCFYEPIK